MRLLKYLLVIVITVGVTLGCVYGFSCVSCASRDPSDGCAAEGAAVCTAVTLSADAVDTDAEEPISEDDEETVEVPQWLKVTFDVVVIALSIGVMVLVWFIFKRFVKKNSDRNRRFG